MKERREEEKRRRGEKRKEKKEKEVTFFFVLTGIEVKNKEDAARFRGLGFGLANKS